VTAEAGFIVEISNEREYAAALDEFDALILSEPRTPPGRRFVELVRLIDEYALRRSGSALPPPGRRQDQPARGNVVTLQQRIGKPRQVLHHAPR
jgi:hypothetical protein